MYILPYKQGSEGCTALANTLGIKQIKREGSKFKGSPDKLVINWGSTVMSEEVAKCRVLNKPEAVKKASNKLEFFRAMKYVNEHATLREELVNIPVWGTSQDTAYVIMKKYKCPIVCRTVLNGHSGQGIVIANNIDELVAAPLYVQYVPKKQEYRIHVLGDKVVDVQRKARRPETPDDQVNWQVRNHDNGFIFVRDEKANEVDQSLLRMCVTAIKKLGLDFGAVDCIYNEKQEKGYLLEINTAPGLTGETLEGYNARFKELEQVFKKAERNRDEELLAFLGEPPAMVRWEIPQPAAPWYQHLTA